MWQGIVLIVMTAAVASASAGRAESPAADQVQSGNGATAKTMLNGYRRYSSVCSHCHGPDGIGSTFAPSLIEQPLPFARFEQIVRDGSASGVSVMRGFADDPNVAPYVRDIYLYLEARADGTIGRGRPALAP
jgi:mono/diheme cytochrome c family protein